MSNHLISQRLLAHARSLQGSANLYRVRSYRHAAMVIDGLDRSIADMINTHGRASIARLPGIGEHLAYTIETLLRTGRVVSFNERERRSTAA